MPIKKRVLLVDDDQEFLNTLRMFLSLKGYDVTTASSGMEAVSQVSRREFDVMVADVSMPEMDGLETMEQVWLKDRHLPVVIITGVGTIENAVRAIQKGAFHYITKPFDPNSLETILSSATAFGQAHRNLATRSERRLGGDILLVGNSPEFKQILELAERIATSDAAVLITGETGTGKSLLAKYIHEKSERREKPFLVVECSTFEEEALQDELIGHVQGAFEGAVSDKPGILRKAEGGTVLLNDVNRLSPATQVKLLKAIQNSEITPLGGNDSLPVDVRCLPAASVIMREEVAQGRFREDLFFRLAVVQFHLPPLRERRSDPVLFVDHFVGKYNKQYGKNVSHIDPGIAHFLISNEWAGNIKELEHAVERAVLLSKDNALSYKDFLIGGLPPRGIPSQGGPIPLKEAAQEAEKLAIIEALRTVKGNKSEASKILGISRPTLYERLETFGLMDYTAD